MEKKLHFALVGASGLVGSCLLDEILQHTEASVAIITRRKLGLSNARCTEIVVDFSNQSALQETLKGVDAVFVAIGTTQKKVKGNMAAYRKIDYDIPIALATTCVANAIPRFLLVSSVGANPHSKNFYLRLKGEVEETIEKMPIPYIGLFQPSVLIGPRPEWRPGEKISQIVMPLISFLLPAQYRAISAKDVAKRMVNEAISDQKGVKRYTYRAMKKKGAHDWSPLAEKNNLY